MNIFSTFGLYLARRYMFWMMMIVFIIISIIGLFEFIELLRRTMTRPNVALTSLLQLTFLKLPFHIQTFFPFLCMIAAKVTLSKLNQDQEIIAIRSLGLSAIQIISSLLFSVLLLGIVNISVINPLSAIMQKRAENIENQVFKNQPQNNQFVFNESGLWLREKLDDNARIIYIKKYNIDLNQFKDIHIFETDKDGILLWRYIAENGQLNNFEWVLYKVKKCHEDDKERIHETVCLKTELSMAIIEDNNAKPETISFWGLPNFIAALYRSGLSPIKYELYFYAQLAKIVQAMALILFAASFCLHPVRYKKTSTLIVIGILSGFALHFLTDIIYALGLSQKIPLLLATFSPALITIFISIGMLMHVEQA